MKGFKATNANMKCRDFQFELNTEFVYDGEIVPCRSGFHFCKKMEDVFNFYMECDTRVFEVEVTGTIQSDGIKSVTNKIKFVRELPIEELYELCPYVLEIKCIAASRKIHLDTLISDGHPTVRGHVAEQGYGLDILYRDPNWCVRRQVAKQGYKLDVLIKDPDRDVRIAVAKQGYGLDILINDPDWNVRVVAETIISMN